MCFRNKQVCHPLYIRRGLGAVVRTCLLILRAGLRQAYGYKSSEHSVEIGQMILHESDDFRFMMCTVYRSSNDRSCVVRKRKPFRELTYIGYGRLGILRTDFFTQVFGYPFRVSFTCCINDKNRFHMQTLFVSEKYMQRPKRATDVSAKRVQFPKPFFLFADLVVQQVQSRFL